MSQNFSKEKIQKTLSESLKGRARLASGSFT